MIQKKINGFAGTVTLESILMSHAARLSRCCSRTPHEQLLCCYISKSAPDRILQSQCAYRLFNPFMPRLPTRSVATCTANFIPRLSLRRLAVQNHVLASFILNCMFRLMHVIQLLHRNSLCTGPEHFSSSDFVSSWPANLTR